MKFKKDLLCDRWKDEENGVYNFIDDMKDTHLREQEFIEKIHFYLIVRKIVFGIQETIL